VSGADTLGLLSSELVDPSSVRIVVIGTGGNRTRGHRGRIAELEGRARDTDSGQGVAIMSKRLKLHSARELYCTKCKKWHGSGSRVYDEHYRYLVERRK